MRAVFLDRDGVLNKTIMIAGKIRSPPSVADAIIVPRAAELLEDLKQAGFRLIVVTNQPEVSRGTTTAAIVGQIHSLMRERLPLDDVFVCFHDDADGCDCRKPKPGMLLEAAAKYGIVLEESFLVGDRWRDIDAGKAAGCRSVLIDHGYSERRPSQAPDATVTDLDGAVRWIIDRTNE